MKRYLVIDDEGQDLGAAVRLLREHGFNVSEQAGGTITGKESNNASWRMRTISDSQHYTCKDIRNAGEAVLVAGAVDGRVLEMSTSFTGLTGYGREELLGQPMLGLSFFLNPESWSDALNNLEEYGSSEVLETRILKKNGLVAFVAVTIRNDSMDGIPCHVMTIRDESSLPELGIGESRHHFGGCREWESLPSEVDINREEIARLIDFKALQDLMNTFYKITRFGIGIIDIKGNVHVATGWQDVCTMYHRIQPDALKNCLESDMVLSQNIREGEFTLYKCKNNLWDIATPIIVGGRHIANIFLGQFFFEDEVPDYEFFRKQAKLYGFDEEQYLSALDRVPRWSREMVENVMEFYSKLAQLISRLSIGNILLSQALAKQKGISEELQQANLVVENSPVVLFRWRAAPGWPVELVSRNVTQFGYTPEELLSGATPFSSMIHPDDLERVAAEVKDYSANGSDSFQQEYRILSKNGDTRWVYDRTVVERDESGGIKHFQGIVIDITERKRAEEALHESTERMQSIFRVAPIGIGVVRNRVILEVNRRFSEMTGYSQEEVVGMKSTMLYPSIEEYERVGMDKYRQITDKGTGILETSWQKKDGSVIDVLLASTPLDPSDLAKGVIFTSLDITDRKRSVERMQSTLAEKVVLLQEVHHRVKNNLQIITSLLDLQSDYINEEGARRFILESQNRIRSMALVHEQLYRSGDFSSIDFSNYVNELVDSLFVALVVDPSRIGFNIEVSDVELDMDRAIPCGLIINELVSNAIKYAFPEGRHGTVNISCMNGDEGNLILEVKDNGVGLPDGLDFRTANTMGLQIVNILVRQLRGNMELLNDKGAAFTVTFPVAFPKSRVKWASNPPVGDFC